MSQTGHRSADMVRKYIREGSLFNSNAAAIAGLYELLDVAASGQPEALSPEPAD
jgi:hypothetical protein